MTIIQLFLRFYKTQEGNIFIDGHSIKEYTQKSVQETIRLVFKKPFIFYDTITTNIAYDKLFLDEKIIKAIKKAHAYEFIEKLPNLYQTMLYKTEKNLFRGEQQRFIITCAS